MPRKRSIPILRAYFRPNSLGQGVEPAFLKTALSVIERPAANGLMTASYSGGKFSDPWAFVIFYRAVLTSPLLIPIYPGIYICLITARYTGIPQSPVNHGVTAFRSSSHSFSQELIWFQLGTVWATSSGLFGGSFKGEVAR